MICTAKEILSGLWIGGPDIFKNQQFNLEKNIDLNINCETTQFNCNYLYKTTKFIHKNPKNIKDILLPTTPYIQLLFLIIPVYNDLILFLLFVCV